MKETQKKQLKGTWSAFKQQKGAALVGVMLVLLVLTLLGTTAFLTSSTEVKISSNYSQSLQAVYAAEAGLQYLLFAYRQNPVYFLQKNQGSEINLPIIEPDRPNDLGTKFWIKNLRYDPQETPAYVEVIMYGKDIGQNSLARLRATIYCAQAGGTSEVLPVFKMGIVTAGTLNLMGSMEISGSIHANRGYSIEPPSVLEQLKQNQFSITQSLDPMRSDYLPSIEFPIISDKEFEKYRVMAQQAGNQILFGQQNLALTGDQKGLLIFVEGDLTVRGENLSGVTLVSTGSITLNGSASLNGDHSLNTAFIAGRGIILNDFSQLAGVFWSNGSIRSMGSGKLLGAIVSQGNISQTEGFQFERISQISNVFLPRTAATYSFDLGAWSQI
jgi:cytoskeletal protein CcmA (bactofilin family)